MLGKIITSFAAIATIATASVPAAVSARDHDRYDYQRGGDYRNNGYNHGRDRHGYRNNDRRAYYGRNDYRGRCKNNGSTGTIVGALAGGLLGNGVAGRGDRTLGTVIGAGGGALAGRAIDRSGSHRC